MNIYLDACAIIYAIEGAPAQQQAVLNVIQQAATGGTLQTSYLSRMECRVLPLRQKNSTLLQIYDAFFTRQGLTLFNISRPLIERATQLRADHRIKAPDAIHVATAMLRQADLFVTGDRDLARIPGINIHVV